MFKKLSIFCIFLFLIFNLTANEHIEVAYSGELEYHNHETYEVWYNTSYNNPAFVIWDLTFEDAVLADSVDNRILREEFGIKPNTEAEVKAKVHIAERNRLRTVEASLMDKPVATTDKPANTEEAK